MDYFRVSRVADLSFALSACYVALAFVIFCNNDCSRCLHADLDSQGRVSLGKGEAEAIDDKNGINACKLLGIAFTTAIGTLVRSREKSVAGRA